MKIYISGKITGEPLEAAAAKFDEAARVIEAQGNEPVNPMHNGLAADAPRELHMAVDILLLMGCDAIYMLSDWPKSNGAITELSVARATGLQVLYEHNDETAQLVKSIADICNVDMADIVSKSRKLMYVYARMILTKLMIERGASVADIQRIINKSYATVLHYTDIYNDEIKYNAAFRQLDGFVRCRIENNETD